MKMTRVGAEENIPCAVELESKKSHAELGKLISENITLKNNEETKIPENTFLFKVSPFVSDNEKVSFRFRSYLTQKILAVVKIYQLQ